MRLGSFLDNREQGCVRYSYRKWGMETVYQPDLICEATEGEFYGCNTGNLFFGKPVAWDGNVLLYGGVDIRIELFERCYADHAELHFAPGSEVESIEIFMPEQGTVKKIGRFHAQTGSTVTDQQIVIPIGVYCDQITVRLNGACKNILLNRLEIRGAWELEHTVYPIPNQAEFGMEGMKIDETTQICARGADALFAAAHFCERFEEKFGVKIKVGEESGSISMFVSEREDDGFDIVCEQGNCRICAGGRRGFLYAAEALLQLCDDTSIKGCRIQDKPFMNFRGVHLALPSRQDFEFLRHMVRDVFVPMRYNAVFLQIAGAMRYDSFPEINEMWQKACENYEKGQWPLPAHYGFVGRDILEKSEVAELCAFLREYGMEVIPEVQSWSHCQYITTAYPQLAETGKEEEEKLDAFAADVKPDQFYKHSMCPSHESYYDVIFKIADEVIDVVKPERFLHMGHDEIYQVCLCDRCKKQDPGELYAQEVSRLNEYIKSKQLTMMIWADMLQEKSYRTITAINQIPKDVIMLDFIWYFHPEEDIEDNLLSHGFKVIMGNMYSSHYPRYESRSKKEGIIGAQISTWVRCSERSYSFKGKMYDFVYSANCMWNKEYDSRMRLTYDEIIRPLLFEIRCRIGGLTLCGEERKVEFSADRDLVPNDLYGCVPYQKAAVCSQRAPKLEIPFEGYADQLSFVHATDVNGERAVWDLQARKMGEYVLCYEDGSEACEDILFGDNIYRYRFRFGTPLSSQLFRHEGYAASYSARPECGKTAEGEDYTLFECFVKNPYPEKKIRRLELRHEGNTDAKILLFDVRARKKLIF